MTRPAVVTIGNFDGVHAGHRHIMRRVATVASEHGWKPVVLTFDPHPTRLVAPERAPRLLTSLQRRRELIHEQGIEDVVVLPFTPEIARLTPDEFVRQILVENLGARAVLVGDNFRFGNRAAGNAETLRDLGTTYGFSTEALPSICRRGRIVSSSEIRRLVQDGKVSLACRLLERPFSLDGKIVPGRGVGSKQTVPTLNLETQAEVLPGRGVYITRTFDSASPRQWNSITNIGYRPTFGGDDPQLSIETFLLHPLAGEPPSAIRLDFLLRIRDERKFESPEDLKTQILKDVSRTQSYFRRRAWQEQYVLK